MKIATKIFLCTVLVLTLGFNMGSTIFVRNNFNHSIQLYKDKSQGEYYTQKYLMESEMITHMSQGVTINDRYIQSLANEMVNTGLWQGKFVEIHCDDRKIFSTIPHLDTGLLGNKDDDMVYTLLPWENKELLVTSSAINVEDITITFTQGMDITPLFVERDRQLVSMAMISVFIVSVSSVILFMLSKYLTRNIEKLAKATREMSNGHYDKQVLLKGNDEIVELSKDFNLMAVGIENNIKQLDDYAKSRDEFVINFSHELKTPMTSIIGYADILRRYEWQDEIQMEAVGYIFSEGKRLEQLSQKMLLLMSIGQTNLQLEKHRLSVLLSKSIKSVTPVLQEKNCTLIIHSDENIWAMCDAPLIQTLMINLICNSVKASWQGKEIIITATSGEGKIHISVEDFGRGILSTNMKHLTETFYMVDKSRKGKNTGVGLSICKQITQAHGTVLTIKSQIGQGTIVSFDLEEGTGA